MTYTDIEIWLIIVVLAIGTFLIRFSFLGLIGNRKGPPWVLRHLRYTTVSVLPALIMPLVLWPSATGGEPDPARLAAAAMALAVGYLMKSAIGAIVAGMGTLYLMLYVIG